MLSSAEKAKFDNGRRAFAGVVRRGRAHVRDALRCLLPQPCVLCAAACGSALMCARCEAAMPFAGDGCPRCALASPGNALCGRCLATPPPYERTIAAWRYAFPADRLLQALKYEGRLALADPLGDALAAAVAARGDVPDILVALPLSRERQRRRGFNHAHEIARRVAFRVGAPLEAGLARVRDAPPQAGLPLRERAGNVRDAFAATRSFDGMRVGLVDDVMTTGATLRAASRALLAAGARSVDALVVARTFRDQGSGIGYQESEARPVAGSGILADTDP
jgi:ComF family protein